IGGPVLIPGLYNGRDRTHFFFDFENNHSSQRNDYPVRTLSMAERTGNFATSPRRGPQPVDPLTRRQFPGGIIPTDRFDPIARYYLDNVIPVPDQESFYMAHHASGDRNKQYTVRIDQLLADKDNLTGLLFVNLNDSSSTVSGGQRSREYDL